MAGWNRPPLPVRWGTGSRPAFVGRGRELAVLADAWSLAQQGARQVVFVGGEAGVGKSRIVAEVAGELYDQDAAVLLGTCIAAMGAPYQPFVEPAAALITAIESGQFGVIDGSMRRPLRSLRIIAGAEPHSAESGPGWQFTRQLFCDAVETVLVAARSRPLVLVLEDVQWAGDTALELLRYLVANTTESSMLLLVTLRTSAADRSADLVSTVAQLYRLDGVRRMDLDGLSTEEIADYLAHAGVNPRSARGPAAALRDQTGGNPFLLHEVLRELSARGGLSAVWDVDLRAPDSVLDTVSHRLAGLPVVHRRTVEKAAVIGEEFSVALLTAVCRTVEPAGTAAAMTYAGLEAGTAVGLLEPVRGLDGHFRFPHGLARQAVLDLMTEYQRAADNGTVARVLEDDFPAADRRVQRLAYHYASAQALGYAVKAVHYLAAAAEAAELVLAHHEAARLFERAAALAGAPEQRDELRLLAARSYLRSSQFSRAREVNELVASTATGPALLRAAIGYEAASWRSGQPGDRCVAMLTAAMGGTRVDERNPLHIRAIAALGRAQAFTAHREHSRINGARAVRLARATGDDRLVAAALQIGLQTANSPGHLSEKLATTIEIGELSERIADLRHLGPAAYHRAAISYIQGDPVGLAAAHADLARTARATGQQFWEWVESCLTFGSHFIRCEFTAAADIVNAARELGRGFEPEHETEGPFGLQTFMLRREAGGLERIRPLITGREDPTQHWAPGLLALYCELGLTGPARRVAGFLLDHALARHRESATWPVVLSFLCDAAVWLEDAPLAEVLHPLAAEYAGLNLLGAEFLALVGSADRQLGALESVLRLPTAETRFETALAMDTRMGSPLHVATTLAAIAIHRRRAGDGAGRVDEVVDRARELCGQYGLVRVQRLLEDTRQPAARLPRQPAGLTAREAEVLCLLGRGDSNRRIADQLFISENTAANHVRSILMKTGATNRTQAAIYASAHGLLDQRPASREAARSARDGVQ